MSLYPGNLKKMRWTDRWCSKSVQYNLSILTFDSSVNSSKSRRNQLHVQYNVLQTDFHRHLIRVLKELSYMVSEIVFRDCCFFSTLISFFFTQITFFLLIIFLTNLTLYWTFKWWECHYGSFIHLPSKKGRSTKHIDNTPSWIVWYLFPNDF